MNRSRRAQWSCLILLGALVAALAGCAPFGVQAPQPRVASATMTAAASATFAATSSSSSGVPAANLPALQPDAGWVVVVQVADGSKFGGPEVIGGSAGGATASVTVTLGAFTLSSATTVAVMFDCVSPPASHTTVEIAIRDADTAQLTCNALAGPQRDEMKLSPSWAGRTLTVSATISTDNQPPQWNLLVEQPK